MALQPRFQFSTALAQQFDMRSLLRLALWGGAAAADLLVAVISARSNLGSQRIMLASRGPQPPAEQVSPVNAQLAARAAENERETKRLSDALHALATDRDRLLTRLTLIERNLEDMTGSINRQTAAAPPPPTKDPAPAAPPPAAQVFAPPVAAQPLAPPVAPLPD